MPKGKQIGMARTSITMAHRAGLDYKTLTEGEKAVFQAVWRTCLDDADRLIVRYQERQGRLQSAICAVKDALRIRAL